MDDFSRKALRLPGLGLLVIAMLLGCGCAKGTKTSDSAASKPAAVPPPPPPNTAEVLVKSMRQSIVIAGEPAHESVIGLKELRNQSHATTEEFDQMRRRLAESLNRASADLHLPMQFAADPELPPDFQLVGNVNLVTTSGFDVWETNLDLRPAAGATTIWRPQGALRILRQPRGDQPEMQLMLRRQ